MHGLEVHQACLHRQQQGVQGGIAAPGGHGFQGLDGEHARLQEGFDPGAAQRGHVGAAAQGFAQVAGQAADVGAGPAGHGQAQGVAVELQQLDRVHFDLALGHFDGLTAPGLHVQGLAALLERGKDRRALADASGQRDQGRLHAGAVERGHRALAQHFAVGVVGVGGAAQRHAGLVGLAAAQQQAGDLGRFAKTQGQQAGGQGIERAGMAALLGAEQQAGTLEGLVRTQAGRLVEQQQAVKRPEYGAAHPAGLQSSAGGTGFSRSSCSMRSPLSTESS